MYSIARDSLFNPRKLINYHKKSGWFAFLYFIVLVIFMSISGIVFYSSYSNSLMTETTTGCRVADNGFVCDGANYDSTKTFDIYGFTIYLLNPSDSVSNINNMSNTSIVLQNNDMSIYLNGTQSTSINILGLSGSTADFAQAIKILTTGLLIIGLLTEFIRNAAILLFVVFIATLTFLRLRKFIPYRKIFKLVIFAATPVALLMTVYDLLRFNELFFILLLFIAYRSVFILQKELYLQTMIKISQQQSESGLHPNVEQGEDIERTNEEDDDDSQDDDENQ